MDHRQQKRWTSLPNVKAPVDDLKDGKCFLSYRQKGATPLALKLEGGSKRIIGFQNAFKVMDMESCGKF